MFRCALLAHEQEMCHALLDTNCLPASLHPRTPLVSHLLLFLSSLLRCTFFCPLQLFFVSLRSHLSIESPAPDMKQIQS